MLRPILLTAICLLSLCPACAQGDHFFTIQSNGDLYKVHLQSCSTTFVGSTGLWFGMGDIALTPSGDLYGLVSGAIYRIDTTDASTTFIGQSPQIGTVAVSLVALNDSTLLTEDAQSLFAIKTSDASTAWIGDIGYGAIGDLVWFFGALYMSAGGELLRIELDNDLSSIQSVTAVGPYNGFMPIFIGLASTTAADGTAYLVAIGSTGLYCYSHLDGSYQLIGQPPLPSGVSGAASAPPMGTAGLGCDLMPTTINDVHGSAVMRAWISSGRLEIRMPADMPAEACTIRDLSGRTVRQAVMAGTNTAAVDLGGMAFGLYSVEVVSGPRTLVKRFVFTGAP